jgi:AAA family ATP:ADP antiporter
MIKRLVDVRDEEVKACVVSFFYFFALMAGYFILRPIRDEMGVAIGSAKLPWLFTATLISMLVLVPLYSALVARVPRPRLIPLVYRFFLVNLLIFFAAWRLNWAPGWTERIFYVWTSVYNLFVVSVFWSFMADIWTSAQGKRLFGFIAAGGSLGSILGSSSVIVLVKPLGSTVLLLVSAALLEAAARMAKYLARDAHAGSPKPVGGGLFDGFWHAVRSPYLFGIVAQTFLFTTTSTFLYFVQVDIMKGFGSKEAVTQFYSTQDLIVNGLAVVLQTSMTGRIVRRLGVVGALAMTPIFTVLAFVAVALWPGVWVVAAMFVGRRVLHFAVDRPSKEMLFTAVDRDDRYKTKNLIDTAVYRLGDQVGSWTYPLLGAFAVPAAIPLAVVWLGVNVLLARGFEARTHVPHSPEGAST